MALESAGALNDTGIIAEYTNALETLQDTGWIDDLTFFNNESNQETEEYKWLSQAPMLREWVGERQAKGLSTQGITIKNIDFESTLDLSVHELRRKNASYFRARINEQVQKASTHWAKLLSTLILNGPSTACYDGQFFFDTDHSEGDSGTQSNDISIDISTLPAQVAGTITAPSPEEMALCITQAISQIRSFKDDTGEPMNENAMEFTIMVPISLSYAAKTAALAKTFASGSDNVLAMSGYKLKVVDNSRLTWTDSFAVFRTDTEIGPLIRQQEGDIELTSKGEGSEYAHDTKRHQYGISASRNVGYGRWQYACYVTMT